MALAAKNLEVIFTAKQPVNVGVERGEPFRPHHWDDVVYLDIRGGVKFPALGALVVLSLPTAALV